MRIVIASGKGGTGKTTFAVNLAYSLFKSGVETRLLDCDVEEPNAHLFIQPAFNRQTPVTVMKPSWNEDKCTACGLCVKACAYNAMALVKENVLIFNELCHACGLCSAVCPEGALTEHPVEIGTVEISDKQPLFFAHGRLVVGEARAPAVVQAVKEYCDPNVINIIDAAPGTACPVVEALEDADLAVLVTEPTPFGRHDLELAAELALGMGIPAAIVVNRSDGQDALIEEYAVQTGVPIAGRIPFSREYAETYARGILLAAAFPQYRKNMEVVFRNLQDGAGQPSPPCPAPRKILSKTGNRNTPGKTINARAPKEIVIVSGKGGTGKTTVTASIAALAEKRVMADCDVDAADLHLLLKPRLREATPFVGGRKAYIDPDRCIDCGQCYTQCRFSAISPPPETHASPEISEHACEGCGLCAHLCPVDAITLSPQVTGHWSLSDTDDGPMADGCLGIGQENSGKLVSQVRSEARKESVRKEADLVAADGPPGTSCPVIATVTGADLAVVVTEPTVSGVHDLKRLLELCRHFKVPARIVVNKADLCAEQLEAIQMLADGNARIIGEIPFDSEVHNALCAGQTPVEWNKGSAAAAMHRIWEALSKEIL